MACGNNSVHMRHWDYLAVVKTFKCYDKDSLCGLLAMLPVANKHLCWHEAPFAVHMTGICCHWCLCAVHSSFVPSLTVAEAGVLSW